MKYLKCILLLLAVAIWSFTPGVAAKYVTNATNTEHAKIAKFDVRMDKVGTDEISISPGETYEYTLYVTNLGETAVNCQFTVCNKDGNIPLEFDCPSLRLEAGDTKPKPYVFTVSWNETDDKDSEQAYLNGVVDQLEIVMQIDQVY